MVTLALAGLAAAQPVPLVQGEVMVLAAGSLRRALTEVAAAFERATPDQRVKLVFGASGLLLDRIRNGERADVFASANLEHPQALVTAGKALQLTGGPNSPPPLADRSIYGVLVADGQADIFITYCTNASQAFAEQPQLKVVAVPAAINVSASYGVAVTNGAPPAADAFAEFLLGTTGQALLARQGFSAP